MIKLSLLRHAKSSWTDAGLHDFDRPLAKRGVKAVPRIARFMREEKLQPSLILCSTAVRTRATLTLLLAELGAPAPPVIYDEALYLAAPERILSLVRETPSRAGDVIAGQSNTHVLVVGHNPGLHALALELAGKGCKKEIAALAMKFPTAALAVLSFAGNDWHALRPASGTLDHFVTPQSLAE